jgi:hypothetical protein
MRAKGKGKYERYVKLRYWLLDSRAWNNLPGNAHSLYVRIVQRYRGNNNGQVPYSVREAAQALHVNKATASRLFKLLEDRGFIVCTKRGAFSLKTVKDASEWRLSEYDSDYPPAHATKDFMRWQPPEGTELYRQKFRTRVFQRNHTGTPTQPPGYSGATTRSKKSGNGYSGATTNAGIDPSMGTPVQHLYLPREGEGTSTARPTPAATRDDDRGVWVFTEKNGAPHKKLPWPTTPPTVTEVPFDSLPTELRMMALGLPVPEPNWQVALEGGAVNQRSRNMGRKICRSETWRHPAQCKESNHERTIEPSGSRLAVR